MSLESGAGRGATPAVGEAPPSRRLRVLLAEDHPINQRVAARLIERLGHEARVVPDGASALAALGAERFDLVLMDLEMPVMDGFEAIAALRGGPDGPRPTVLALTGHDSDVDRARCLAAGFDGHLAKPIRLDALAEALRPLLADEDEDDADAFEAGLADRCGGDEALARELIAVFRESAPGALASAERAIADGDPARLADAAHGLRGASLTIGADALASACAAIESAGSRGDVASAVAALQAARESWGRLERLFGRRRGTDS